MIDNRVSFIFDEMQDSYDNIDDLWYSWIFSRLHFFITKEIILKFPAKTVPQVLDIGCGTGFQSILYALAGYRVIGIDISSKLTESASKKIIGKNSHFELFEPKFNFVKKYNRKINTILRSIVKLQIIQPSYFTEDATNIMQPANSFDLVNCCGSTLSFVENHEKAISEIARCLKSGGRFILEVEAKQNMDLIWTLLDSTIFFGRLGYETSFKEALNLIFKNKGNHVNVEYPFGESKNPVYMNIKLFNKKKLIKELKSLGLIVEKTKTIHSVTNLIPSTILDSQKPGSFTIAVFNLLAFIESHLWFSPPGCSMVFIGRKME